MSHHGTLAAIKAFLSENDGTIGTVPGQSAKKSLSFLDYYMPRTSECQYSGLILQNGLRHRQLLNMRNAHMHLPAR